MSYSIWSISTARCSATGRVMLLNTLIGIYFNRLQSFGPKFCHPWTDIGTFGPIRSGTLLILIWDYSPIDLRSESHWHKKRHQNLKLKKIKRTFSFSVAPFTLVTILLKAAFSSIFIPKHSSLTILLIIVPLALILY